MRKFCIPEISVYELSTFDTGQLKRLSRQIANSHLERIAQASPVSLANHVVKSHEFGVSLDDAKGKTDEGKCQRLCDPAFWFRRLVQIADKARESIAVRNLRLGDPAYGLEPYCSDESLKAYLERQSGRSINSLQCLQREIEKAAHSSYLTSKALCERAFAAGHLSVLITLGLDGRFHSSSPQYQGFAFDDAHAALHGIYEPLLDGLSRRGIRGGGLLWRSLYRGSCGWLPALACSHLSTPRLTTLSHRTPKRPSLQTIEGDGRAFRCLFRADSPSSGAHRSSSVWRRSLVYFQKFLCGKGRGC